MRRLSALDADDIAALGAKGAAALEAEQMVSLAPEAVAGFGAAQAAALQPEALAALSPSQVARLGASALGAMHAEQLSALSPKQVAALDARSIAAIGKSAGGARDAGASAAILAWAQRAASELSADRGAAAAAELRRVEGRDADPERGGGESASPRRHFANLAKVTWQIAAALVL